METTGLTIHRSSRTTTLAGELAGILSEPLADPFATEIISVPSPGVERWLSQTLSTHLGAGQRSDGVCAGIRFPRLDQLIRSVIDQAAGIDPALDPWHPDRGVWSVMRTLDARSGESWLGPVLRRWDSGSISRRYVTARRIFDLFQGYARQRPELLEHWRRGDPVDASGQPLAPDTRWQALLWAALRAEVGGLDPIERLHRATEVLAVDPSRVDLPDRISVFGLTRVSAEQSRMLAALADHRAVHLWLSHPSAVMWQRIAESGGGRVLRSDDPTTLVPQHRLNRRLGRDARELQLCLADLGGAEKAGGGSIVTTTNTVLDRLQQAIRDDVDEPTRLPVRATDTSIRVHSCHGPDRQVEVLREVVLGLLTDHPDLELRDIIVMCPDIETFAPLISAAFALEGLPGTEVHPGQALTIRLADRSLREINPLLATLQTLLDLGESRAGQSLILDLCAQEPIARRFGFSEIDLERLVDLVSASGVRWGLDQEHRARFNMAGFGQNTWRAGLERMLLGVALDDAADQIRGSVLALGEVESSDVQLIGRLVELVSRLERIVQSFSGTHSLPEWMAACREALTLVAEVAPSDTWQLTHAWSELSNLAETGDRTGVEVSLGDIRALLATAFAGRPSRANFRTGALTMCTMTPMRSVPHRVVILLGIDDGVFPRRGRTDGDDLLAMEPWVGDRDPRSEDRQILLDAVMAASEQLVLIHSGADPRTGAQRPPSVLLAEVKGAIEDLCSDDPWPILEVRHPLQPFSPTNFHPVPFSFDPHGRAAAEAHLRSGTIIPPLTASTPSVLDPLPPPDELAADPVPMDLSDVLNFFAHPARDLLKRRAKIYVRNDSEADHPDEIPIQLTGLQEWAVGERMLTQHLAGVPLMELRDAELRRGEVPPRERGMELLTRVARRVQETQKVAAPWLAMPADSRWISADLGRWQLTGMITGLRDRTLLRVGYSNLSGKQRLASWIELLALKVAHPEIDWRAVTIGNSGRGRVLGPIPVVDARARLNELLTLWARGQSEVIPLPPRTAAVQAESADNRERVSDAWRHECDRAWQRVGYQKTLTSLNGPPASSADGGGNRSAFQALTVRVWAPLLDVEGVL